MSQRAPDLRRFRQVLRRFGTLVGLAVAAGVLAGAVAAAFSPVTVTSTALVVLPGSTPGTAAAVAIAGGNPVLAGALARLSPVTSLETLRGEVQVTSPTPNVLAISARAGTAARAAATANAVAESYSDYVGSAASPAGHARTQVLQYATTATGTAPLMRLLAGALLGVASGVLAGVIAALVSRRPVYGPLCDSLGSAT
jgi:hypothetical protein